MNTIKKFGAFTSSIDPNKLGTTVEGFIMGASVFIIYFCHLMGINIGTAEVSTFAVQIGAIVSTVMILFGMIRKFVVFISSITVEEDTTDQPPTVQVINQDQL